MSVDEKLQLIERVLQVEENTLTEDTPLAELSQWDSLAILNLQIELTVIRPDLSFDDLYKCERIWDICEMF